MIIDSLFCRLNKWFVELSKPFEEHVWGEQPLINIYCVLCTWCIFRIVPFFVFTPHVDIVLTKIITSWLVSFNAKSLSVYRWKHVKTTFMPGIWAGVDCWLVGGDWNIWIIFPYIVHSNPNWLIFFRGVGQPSTRYTLYHIFL